MIAYAKQEAWLNSVPKKNKIDNQMVQKTRLETLLENGGSPLLPDVGEAFYLVEYWHNAGCVGQGFAGPVALTWQEIVAWQKACGLQLIPFETKTIRSMSEAYAGQWHLSQALECPPPYGGIADLIDRETVKSKVGRLFKAQVKNQET